jgi:8-oxo-dGTP pyrophosphatase MutT (NUDIX family)
VTADQLRTERAVSAGGVIYRTSQTGEIEVVLCGRMHDGLWALPKGTPHHGETLREAAQREVREETGLGVSIAGDLGTITYVFDRPAKGVRYEKTVQHYLMTPDGAGATDLHDNEYDRVEWFPAAEAMRLLTHANERDVLRRAMGAIEAGVRS